MALVLAVGSPRATAGTLAKRINILSMRDHNDQEWWEGHIRAVVERNDYWETTDEQGLIFYILKKHGITPAIGDTLRYYGSGAPNAIRGVEINGKRVFYESQKQFEERLKAIVEKNPGPMVREDDKYFSDYTILTVHDIGSYWRIIDSGNLTYNLPKEFGVKPVPGDTIRYYGGAATYGIDINGKKVFYEPFDDEPSEFDTR